jgi:ribosomal subunit interface protein
MQTASLPVVVKGKNIAVTPALEQHVRAKAAKLERIFANHPAANVEAVLRTEKDGHIAEITLYVGGYVLRGESRTPDMYHSINKSFERIEGQLRKFKTKLTKKLREEKVRSGATIHDDAGEFANGTESSRLEAKIVRRKRFMMKPMTVDEAVMQMELLGHDFFLFANAETDEVNVVYKRKDGKYGLLEPMRG